MDGLGLDGDRCIRVIPQQVGEFDVSPPKNNRYVRDPEQVSQPPRWINGEALLPMNRLTSSHLHASVCS